MFGLGSGCIEIRFDLFFQHSATVRFNA